MQSIKFSIIIPIYNEEKYIGDCLKSIIRQSYKGNVEIIIIDGLSTDKTLEIIKEFSDKRIKIFYNHKRITPTAINIGINNAKGDIIIRIDGHWTIPKNFIKTLFYSIMCPMLFTQIFFNIFFVNLLKFFSFSPIRKTN